MTCLSQSVENSDCLGATRCGRPGVTANVLKRSVLLALFPLFAINSLSQWVPPPTWKSTVEAPDIQDPCLFLQSVEE